MKSQLLATLTLLLLGCPLASAQTNSPIPWDQIGAKAGADYQGDGLAVSSVAAGAHLRCVFQRLEGDATTEGLWLTSTASDQPGDRFRVTAVAVGRSVVLPLWANLALPGSGAVDVEDRLVRFVRPGLVEEYSVSMDGVRQDFVVLERPAEGGELRVELSVTGATAEPLVDGVRLTLAGSERKLNYGRLRVTDTVGRELSARMEVVEDSDLPFRSSDFALAIVVDDSAAVYPVRIDPTVSDADWVGLGGISGANGVVVAMAVNEAGHLFVGGSFTAIGSTFANYVAQWDGNVWSPLGTGASSGVSALAVSGGDLYAAGRFKTTGGGTAKAIARWDGNGWNGLGSGLDGSIAAMAVSGGKLYVGGTFPLTGWGEANGIAVWDGSIWNTLGSRIERVDGLSSAVSALAVQNGIVYAGGSFSTIGGVEANGIAAWDGSNWTALGTGIRVSDANRPDVRALAVLDGVVYAGGGFTTIGGVEAKGIAKWDGANWSALGSGAGGSVVALAVAGGNLFAGGGSFISRWNGSSWTKLGTVGGFVSGVVPLGVMTLAASGGSVFAGGDFTAANGRTANRIAEWDGSTWNPLSSGMNNDVTALAVSGDAVYVGGKFTTTSGGGASCIAKWNGSAWTALGSGMSGTLPGETTCVFALVASGDNLYAGGSFIKAGGVTVNNIAKWDGSNWSALGSGMDQSVLALAVVGDDLYAGGRFSKAGGNWANYVARWDGDNWNSLGGGVSGTVEALAASGSNLFVGGTFTRAGGITVNNIAQWNGNSWSSLGSGMDGFVKALAVSGDNLYAAGKFTRAGDTPAKCIARWDSSRWSALGAGLDAILAFYPGRALAVRGNKVYAGGDFFKAGGSFAQCVAQWSGSGWSPLGSGVGPSVDYRPVVNALAVSAGDLFVGGVFYRAGDKVSAYVAKVGLRPLPLQIDDVGFSDGRFHFALSGPPGAAALISTSTDLQVWIPVATNSLANGSLQFTSSAAQDTPKRFYRVALQP